MRTFRFVVPVVPEKKLSPNHFVHWGQKARAKKQMKADWGYAIAAARGDQQVWSDPIFDGPVSMKITVYWPKGRTIWDNDNVVAACKSGIDACQENGVVINDAQIDSPIIAQDRSAGDGYVEVELVG